MVMFRVGARRNTAGEKQVFFLERVTRKIFTRHSSENVKPIAGYKIHR